MADLSTLRAEIDAIDDELITLLKKRIGVVSQVGALKREAGESGLFIRPGREGKMHRRIVEAFEDTPYPPQAMLGIWRLLIASSTHHESPLTLGVLQSEDEPKIASLAREYFGGFLQCRMASNSGSLLADLRDGKVNIGVVPFPHGEQAWWHQLAQYRESGFHIFALLPAHTTRPGDAVAMAIGPVRPEESGDDVSYYALQMEETVSTSRLHTLFGKASLKAEIINAITQPPVKNALVRIDGFFPPESSEIEGLKTQLEGTEIRWLGAHPKPVKL